MQTARTRATPVARPNGPHQSRSVRLCRRTLPRPEQEGVVVPFDQRTPGSERDSLTGRVLDGRYRVGPRIARGGMASVYEATDTRLDRTVALKVMHPGLGDDDDFAARFVREARAAARLTH